MLIIYQGGRMAPLRRMLRDQDNNTPTDFIAAVDESIPSIHKKQHNRQIPGLVLNTNGHNAVEGSHPYGQGHTNYGHGRPANHPRSQSAGCGSALARLPPLAQLRTSNSNASLVANMASVGGSGGSSAVGSLNDHGNTPTLHSRLMQQSNQRVIQSAPAVSRSVNLPPIGSQTPTYKAKKHPPTMMSLPESDRR